MRTERFQVQNIIIMVVMVEIIEKIMVVVEVVGGCGDDDQRKNYPKAPKGREPKQKKKITAIIMNWRGFQKRGWGSERVKEVGKICNRK